MSNIILHENEIYESKLESKSENKDEKSEDKDEMCNTQNEKHKSLEILSVKIPELKIEKKSVLELTYVLPSRPFSRQELYEMREKNFKILRLSTNVIKHNHNYSDTNYKHFYFARKGGKKDKCTIREPDYIFRNTSCSVCWKLNKTPSELKERANKLIKIYYEMYDMFHQNLDKIPYFYLHCLFEIEKRFHIYLYFEFQ